MKTFDVQFRYQDRNQGQVESTIKVDATALPGAVAKATRQFVKALDRKQRFDMNKSGLQITAMPSGSAEAQADKSTSSAS
jgi:transcription initiation factor IIE alpha subunit